MRIFKNLMMTLLLIIAFDVATIRLFGFNYLIVFIGCFVIGLTQGHELFYGD